MKLLRSIGRIALRVVLLPLWLPFWLLCFFVAVWGFLMEDELP